MGDLTTLADLSREELIALIREQSEGGIKLEFSGKSNARRLAEMQARNLLIEGDNLQPMVTLHRERGQVDLIWRSWVKSDCQVSLGSPAWKRM